MQDWAAISGKRVELGYPARNRQVFLIGPDVVERDLPAHLDWLGLYNLVGNEGWEFISNAYHNEHSGYHNCGRHGTLEHFATFTVFKKQL
jgi:hypothetical protein